MVMMMMLSPAVYKLPLSLQNHQSPQEPLAANQGVVQLKEVQAKGGTAAREAPLPRVWTPRVSAHIQVRTRKSPRIPTPH